MIKTIKKMVGKKKRRDIIDADYSLDDIDLFERLRSYTMTSPARMYALKSAVEYVVKNGIHGAIVECGVWRGGSMMLVAYMLEKLQCDYRELYLFDTFEGMPPPTQKDRNHENTEADVLLARESISDPASVWCYADILDVAKNMKNTNYPQDLVHLIKGKVESTIPSQAPSEIAILRLDTDWYESTLHELTHLYPRIAHNGILIIDDYGHWKGAREAVDTYFRSQLLNPLLHRIDYTGRLVVKNIG